MKAFNIRNIPENLHQAWKLAAAFAGISMEKFALTAITNAAKKKLKTVADSVVDATEHPPEDPSSTLDNEDLDAEFFNLLPTSPNESEAKESEPIHDKRS